MKNSKINIRYLLVIFVVPHIIFLLFESCSNHNSDPIVSKNINDPQNFWTKTSGPLTTNTILIHTSGAIYVGDDSGDVYYSSDLGATWNQSKVSNSGIVKIIQLNENILLLANKNGQIFKSMDNGITWQQDSTKINANTIFDIIPISDQTFIAGTDSGVSVAEVIDSSITYFTVSIDSLSIFSLGRNSYGLIFAGSSGKGLFGSSDDGQHWHETNLNSGWISSIFILPNDEIYVGQFSNAIIHSIDTGRNWTTVSAGMSNYVVYDFAINSEGKIYNANSGGVYYLDQQKLEWQRVDYDYEFINVIALTVDQNDYLFAGTDGSGLYRSTKPTVQ